MGKLTSRSGTMFAPPIIPDLLHQHAEPQDRHPARRRRRVRHLATPDRDAAPQRLRAELRLPDQEDRRPVPGDPRGRRTRTGSSPEDLEQALHPQRRRQEHGPAHGRRDVEAGRSARSRSTTLNQFTSVTFNFNLMPGVTIGEATDFIDDAAARGRARRPSAASSRARR